MQSFFTTGGNLEDALIRPHHIFTLRAPLDLVVKEAKGSSYTECNYTYDASSLLPRPCSLLARP